MTVAELIEQLEDFDPDQEVLVAIQPSWPLQFHTGDVTEVDGTVYLTHGDHPDHPYAPREIYGD